MSVKIIDVIYRHPAFKTITPGQKVVVQYLANRANNETLLAWPKLETIERDLGINRRTVQRALQSLRENGLIEIERGGCGQGSTNAVSFAHLVGKSAQSAPPSDQSGRRVSRNKTPAPRVTKCHPCAGSKGDILDIPRVTFSTSKGDIFDATYKEEPRKNQEEEPEVADATARTTTASATATVCDSPRKSSPTKSSPSPTSSSAISPHAISHSDLDMAALCEVTGILFGVSGKMNDEKLRQTILALRQKPTSPHSPPATPENIRRFGQAWRASGKTRPYPSQVFQFWDNTLCPPEPTNANATTTAPHWAQGNHFDEPNENAERRSAGGRGANSGALARNDTTRNIAAPAGTRRYESAGERRNRAHEQHMAKLARDERELLEQLGVDSLDEALARHG